MTLSLSIVGIALGIGLIVLHLPCLVLPARARAFVLAFPRNRAAAWLLTGIAVVWVAVLLHGWNWSRFEGYKPGLFLLTPVSIWLICTYVDELLAARALGGLLMLLPSPMLDAARWHAQDARLLVQILAYIWAIQGTILMVSPYRFRRQLSGFVLHDSRMRMLGAAGVGIGAVLLLLGLTVY